MTFALAATLGTFALSGVPLAAAATPEVTCHTHDVVTFQNGNWTSQSTWKCLTADGRSLDATVSETGTAAPGSSDLAKADATYTVHWSDGSQSTIKGRETEDTPEGSGEVVAFAGDVIDGSGAGDRLVEHSTAMDTGNGAVGDGIVVLERP